MHASMRAALALSTAALLVLIPFSGVAAASDTVTVQNNRGPLANAWFSTLDPSGCVETDTFVTANRPTYQQLPGRGTTTGIAAVSVFEYDRCLDTVLLDAVGASDAVPAAAFQVSNQLDRAALATTITLTNIDTGATFDATVDVAWIGTSDIVRNHDNTNDFYGGGCHVLTRWKGSGRTAEASGRVSAGVTNFTPATSQSAEIGFVVDGFEVINCP